METVLQIIKNYNSSIDRYSYTILDQTGYPVVELRTFKECIKFLIEQDYANK